MSRRWGRPSVLLQELPDGGGGDADREAGVGGYAYRLLIPTYGDVDGVRGLGKDDARELPAAAPKEVGALARLRPSVNDGLNPSPSAVRIDSGSAGVKPREGAVRPDE